jgi:hypothetical protein
MGTVINLRDYQDEWKEVFATDGPNSTLQVYVNKRTGAAEVVQQNDDGETIRTPLDFADTVMLLSTVSLALENKGKGVTK